MFCDAALLFAERHSKSHLAVIIFIWVLWNHKRYLESIDEIYKTDAYHSLSIECYTVSPELIEKVKVGDWNINDESDRNLRDTLAARGYWQTTVLVKQSIEKILVGQKSGEVVEQDQTGFSNYFHPMWLLALLTDQI